MLFQAASLTIDTIRTFFLVVLAILGPIAFAISCGMVSRTPLSSGFVDTYRPTYGCLWLNFFSTILAKIQVLMLQNDISELTNNRMLILTGATQLTRCS